MAARNTHNREVRRMSQDIRRSHVQIKEAYTEMLLRLAIAAEYKDPDIGTHIIKVSDYATAIARSMGLPGKEIDVIRYASMVHDIGKIGIPQTILSKRTSLTKAEYEIVKQHPLIGGKIFAGSTAALVVAAGEIALTHHERYNGAGYPRGLKGDRIPLYGRIVAVADFFDALTSKRTYKSAQCFDEVVAVLKKRAGTFFDPQVIVAFVKTKSTMKKILKANITIDTFIKEITAQISSP